MSGAHLYNRVDLEDGLVVTIKPITVRHQPGYLLVLTDLDSRMECGRRIFPTFAAAHRYAESCFTPEDADHA
jgi:UPF0288 family protein (methanogenesis marker protein 3)